MYLAIGSSGTMEIIGEIKECVCTLHTQKSHCSAWVLDRCDVTPCLHSGLLEVQFRRHLLGQFNRPFTAITS